MTANSTGEEKDSSGDRKPEGMVISVEWYDGVEGLLHQRVPTLCVALEGGIIQLSRGVDDSESIVVNCHMEIRQVKNIGWTHVRLRRRAVNDLPRRVGIGSKISARSYGN